jgi:MFS family permease
VRAQQFLQALGEHAGLNDEQLALAEQSLTLAETEPSWLLRMLIGISAWIASLLVLVFVLMLPWSGGLELYFGLGMVIIGIILRRATHQLFFHQLALALALAGQALSIYFIVDKAGFAQGMASGVLLHAVLFACFPDRIHRSLSLLFAGLCAVAWSYAQQWQALVPVLAAAPGGALFLSWQLRQRLFYRGLGRFVWPLEVGLLLASAGLLLLSCAYILPELGDAQAFPRPWLASLILLPPWCLVCLRIARALNTKTTLKPLALALLLGLLSLPMPGTLMGLIVLGHGLANRHYSWIRVGLAFLLVFLVAFFYGNQVSMPVKAATLVLCGASLLWLRHFISRGGASE